MTIAIPVSHNRISPVLDSAARLRLVVCRRKREVARKEFVLGPLPAEALARNVAELHVDVLLCALVTAAMFRRHGGRGFWAVLVVGYFGSVGVASLSDCLLPYAGEWLLALPHRGLHLGFIEKWWLVNPLAFGGILIGSAWPHTRFPHAGHVLLSTWASLFHITMALGLQVSLADGMWIALFLFLSVWLPCCTSDIVFPLLLAPRTVDRRSYEERINFAHEPQTPSEPPQDGGTRRVVPALRI